MHIVGTSNSQQYSPDGVGKDHNECDYLCGVYHNAFIDNNFSFFQGFLKDTFCPCCSGVSESLDHLFKKCPLTYCVLDFLGSWYKFPLYEPNGADMLNFDKHY